MTDAKSSSRLRVMTLIHSPSAMGGAERVAFDIATSLNPGRYESVLCGIKRPRLPTRAVELEQAGVRYFELGHRSIRDPTVIPQLVRLLRRERIDILHSHLWDSNLVGAIAGRLARTPIVVAHEHTWSYVGERLRVLTDRFVISRCANAYVCVSEYDRQKTIEVEHLTPERVRVIRNGIQPLSPGSRRVVREELGLPDTAQIVGAVAVLRRQKRLDVLVEALAILARRLPDVHLVIAGSDAGMGGRREIEAAAVRFGVRERLHLLGRRDDVADVIAAFDVACLSSDFEGMPLALMEYMAATKPIVATRVGGVTEVVKDGAEALLVERRDPGALAAAIEELLLDPELAVRLACAAKVRQEREFSVAAVLARVEEMYEELYGGRDTAPPYNASAVSSAGSRGV